MTLESEAGRFADTYLSYRLTMFGMMRWALLFTVFVAFSAPYLTGQNKDTCTYVVKEVSFENTKGLTSEQVERLRGLVVGRCYDPVESEFISQYVYEQLREWGYCKATVYAPNYFRVLDRNIHPSPIAVAIDFLLTASSAEQK